MRKASLIDLIILIFLLLSILSCTNQKHTESYLLNKNLKASKRTGDAVQFSYTGIYEIINSENEIEISALVEDSPAYKAELKPGDVIVSINGYKIREKYDFFKRFINSTPGSNIKIEIRRDGKILNKRIVTEIDIFHMYLTFLPNSFIRMSLFA